MIENHFTVTEITLTKVATKQGQPEKIAAACQCLDCDTVHIPIPSLKKKQRNCKPSATININNEVPLSLCGLSALVLLFLALTVKSRSTAVQVRKAGTARGTTANGQWAHMASMTPGENTHTNN